MKIVDVVVYLDGMLMTGGTEQEKLQKIQNVQQMLLTLTLKQSQSNPRCAQNSQIEREGLALKWGSFTSPRGGRKFKLVTDHKPLPTLFRGHKSLPTTVVARSKGWQSFSLFVTIILSTVPQRNMVIQMAFREFPSHTQVMQGPQP